MILGDSLLVMTSLAEKEGLKGQVQTIYIDPPYGIKFGSNWQVSTRKRDVKDGKDTDLRDSPSRCAPIGTPGNSGSIRTSPTSEIGSWSRRDLLTESGSVFVQIGDENVHLVRALLDEVFGRENFAAQINFKKTGQLPGGASRRTYDYLLWYREEPRRRQVSAAFPRAGRRRRSGIYAS